MQIFFLFFILSMLSHYFNPILAIEPDPAQQIQDLIAEKKAISLANIPFFKSLILPEIITNFLNKIIITAPIREVNEEIRKNAYGTEEKWKITSYWGIVELFGFPIRTLLQTSSGISLSSTNISFYLLIPNGFKFSNISSNLSFLDSLPLPSSTLVLSSSDFELSNYEVTLYKGLNFLALVELKGYPFENISALFGERLNQLELQGILTPDFVSSMFTATLPGKIRILNFETLGAQLQINWEQSAPQIYVPAASIITGFALTWPEISKEKLIFKGGMKITPLKGELWGSFDAALKIPSLPGAQLFLNRVAVSGAIDWAQLIATKGLVPISGLGFEGIISIDPEKPNTTKTFAAAIKAEASTSGIGDFILMGAMTGSLSLEEIIDFGARQFKEATQKDLKPLYAGKIPHLTIADTNLTVVPKTMRLANKAYPQQFTLKGKLGIFNTNAELNISVSWEGIRGLGYLSNTEFYLPGIPTTTPIMKITGFDPAEPGAKIDLKIDLEDIYFIVSGKLVIPPLGNSSAETKITITPFGFFLKTTYKLLGHYDSDLEIKGNLSELGSPDVENFYIKCTMKQDLLKYIESEVIKAAQQLVPNFNAEAQKKLNDTNAEIDRLTKIRDDYYYKEIEPHMKNCLRMGQEKYPNGLHKYPLLRTESDCWANYGEIIKLRDFYNGKNIEINTLKVYRETILKPISALISGALGTFANVAQAAATLLARGFTIESFTLDGKLSELFAEGKLAKVTIKLIFLGKHVELKDMQFNFADIPGSVGHIINQLSKIPG